jgi:enoyl-CoA hydratase
MLERTLTGKVLTLRLAHGKASALDLELCGALREAFDAAAADDGVDAIIVTGTGSIFCAGVDLPRMISAGGSYVQDFVEALDAAFRGIFVCPKPVIAAMNGHAIAGGAILGFACDHRLMSGGRIGVPEPLVGVPFPPLALEIIRYAVPRQHLQPLVYFGNTMDADAALTIGLIDAIVPADALLARAHEVATQFAAIPRDTFRITKRQLREPYLRDSAHIASTSADEIDAIWAAPSTHEHIRGYLERTLRKR